MREIKFRGKTINGYWVYGNVSVIVKSMVVNPGTYISNEAGSPFAYQVRPETVGQYTGRKDKKGTEIYEGDILRSIHQPEPHPIVYDNACFMWGEYPLMVQDDDEGNVEILKETTWCEVIGNIYETPQLLERRKL